MDKQAQPTEGLEIPNGVIANASTGVFTPEQEIAIREIIREELLNYAEAPKEDGGPTCLFKSGEKKLFSPGTVKAALADGWKDKPSKRGRKPKIRG